MKTTWDLMARQDLEEMARSFQREEEALAECRAAAERIKAVWPELARWVDNVAEQKERDFTIYSKVCPGCGYGISELGIILVARPKRIVKPTDHLCSMCRTEMFGDTGCRRPGDPVLSPE